MKDDNYKVIRQLRKLDGFKLAICGSRHFDVAMVERLIKNQWDAVLVWHANLRKTATQLPCAVISGGAKGVDRAAANLAHELTGKLAFLFLADWVWHGKRAGPLRNSQIAREADALLLIWDGRSRGSRDVLSKFDARGKPVYEVEVEIVPTRKTRKR